VNQTLRQSICIQHLSLDITEFIQMKKIILTGLTGLAFGLFLSLSCAYGQTVGQDMKDAGHDTAHASKTVAHKTAHGTKVAARDTEHGTKVATRDTVHGTKVGAHDTAHATKTGYHKTVHGTKKVVHKVDGEPSTTHQ
jgi:hypothetical protein